MQQQKQAVGAGKDLNYFIIVFIGSLAIYLERATLDVGVFF